MKKLFSIIFFALILLVFYFILNQNISKKEPHINSLKSLNCDLNVNDCAYKLKDKQIIISLNPKPIKSLQNTKLLIKNLGTYENLELKIYGLNMFMGEIKPKIYKINKTDYESQFILSSCSMHTMRFRAELLDNNKSIFHFDFDLKR
ncbi:hypothetical protein [Campylobacter taeniopygiae]|uniref:Periplasmic protein n=1 Tax=Campylobacter taeniopygiae TaxID=2510188 RepID=A0ABY2TH90_9BACT|nr:hypothetical protein [Campylobacter taeniopygiae]TKX33480.1 hypothetical protein CQA75_07215 [Campylobacter taeniopygiae]